ncbi:MAG: HlyC/CorC family transporter, partial [Firmicutes bacterium]|nr:HlyC/CorC family transporter [Bacillota bacterium]
QLFGGEKKEEPSITEEELKLLFNVGQEEGVLEHTEREMLDRVFDFGDRKAKDVMTPRTDICAIERSASFEEIAEVFRTERFSRIPVYNEDVDDIVGILHFKDIAFENPENFRIDNYMQEVFFTFESKGVAELFFEMRTRIIPMAVVLDEYGGTSGLLTIEDMVEEVMGEIADEQGEDTEDIRRLKENVFMVEGTTRIEDVNDMLLTSLESEDFDTIGGYVTGLFGRFPAPGETIEEGSLRFLVDAVEKNRIQRLKITKDYNNTQAMK